VATQLVENIIILAVDAVVGDWAAYNPDRYVVASGEGSSDGGYASHYLKATDSHDHDDDDGKHGHYIQADVIGGTQEEYADDASSDEDLAEPHEHGEGDEVDSGDMVYDTPFTGVTTRTEAVNNTPTFNQLMAYRYTGSGTSSYPANGAVLRASAPGEGRETVSLGNNPGLLKIGASKDDGGDAEADYENAGGIQDHSDDHETATHYHPSITGEPGEESPSTVSGTSGISAPDENVGDNSHTPEQFAVEDSSSEDLTLSGQSNTEVSVRTWTAMLERISFRLIQPSVGGDFLVKAGDIALWDTAYGAVPDGWSEVSVHNEGPTVQYPFVELKEDGDGTQTDATDDGSGLSLVHQHDGSTHNHTGGGSEGNDPHNVNAEGYGSNNITVQKLGHDYELADNDSIVVTADEQAEVGGDGEDYSYIPRFRGLILIEADEDAPLPLPALQPILGRRRVLP
jgi:hypothetical protein